MAYTEPEVVNDERVRVLRGIDELSERVVQSLMIHDPDDIILDACESELTNLGNLGREKNTRK